MSDYIISVESLSKCYKIGRQATKGDGLRHVLEKAVRAPFHWLRNGNHPKDPTIVDFWAVRDLSFQIQPGETVGIIGRNGAGKSTVLKLLSRITEPTSGAIRLRGRVASLLEVGTGFHPELTGRENIFLNGAVLGMTRLEIKRKFDEIVAFAEIDQFLDTPVKRYSSGMYVRLAFAVAAHLEPEILIVDEVLAVGDAAFQKKCIGKMGDVSTKEGRTVILVSHQIPAIQNLCDRCILMDRGNLVKDGKTRDVLTTYLAKSQELGSTNLCDRTDRSGEGRARVTAVSMVDTSGNQLMEAVSGSDVILRISYSTAAGKLLKNCLLNIDISGELRSFIGISTALTSNTPLVISGEGHIDCLIPNWPLMGGKYNLSVYLECEGEAQDVVDDAKVIDTVDGDFFGTGKAYHSGWHGNYVLVPHSWTQHDSKSRAAKNFYALGNV